LIQRELVLQLHQQLEILVDQLPNGVEVWYARELQELLGYREWRSFSNVIEKAKTSCGKAGQQPEDHFVEVTKMIDLGKGATREIPDLMLTRYACYLIAQNGDPKKSAIAFAQTYFAVQTRQIELIQQRLSERERLVARKKLADSESAFSRIIFERLQSSEPIPRIRSKGDEALFGGFTTKRMKQVMAVPDGRALADFLPTIIIKAKDFATEITNTTVERDGLTSESAITQAHVKNNADIRGVLLERSIVPEASKPAEDTQKLQRRVAAEEKSIAKLPSKTVKPTKQRKSES